MVLIILLSNNHLSSASLLPNAKSANSCSLFRKRFLSGKESVQSETSVVDRLRLSAYATTAPLFPPLSRIFLAFQKISQFTTFPIRLPRFISA